MSRQAGLRFFFSIIIAQLIIFTICAGNDQDDFWVMKPRDSLSWCWSAEGWVVTCMTCRCQDSEVGQE